GLDERPDALGREAADEHKSEVARVCEARFVECQRLLEAPSRHGFRRLWLSSRTTTGERAVDGPLEYRLCARHLVCQQRQRLRLHRGERRWIGARLREAKVQELE